jgi:hypothetical protein
VSIPPDVRFFYVKVMKTGGGTFLQHILSNFERDEVYPYEKLDPDIYGANYRIDYLTGLPPERRARIRVYTGHFPFVAAQLIGAELVTFTVLRDPVERTISYLKHCKHYHEQHRSLSLDQIYEDPFFFPTLIRDHQAKLFAMTVEDEPQSYLDVMEIDDRRLEIAKSNLEKLDVLGLQDRFEEFLSEMTDRFGWHFSKMRNRHVSDDSAVSSSLRRRIVEDNAAELAFYEHAQALYEKRRRAGALA